MTIDDKVCEHKSMYYTDTIKLFDKKVNLYRCESCYERLEPNTAQYKAVVSVYNGLRLEKKP